MAFQFSDATVNASLDAVETAIGASPTLEIRSGAAPANTAAADAGTLLCSISLPSDFMAAASSRSKAKSGTWSGTGAAGAGSGTNAGHFRIKQGATCHIQGSVTVTGGGGDMTMANVNIAQNQAVSVDTFTLNGPAA